MIQRKSVNFEYKEHLMFLTSIPIKFRIAFYINLQSIKRIRINILAIEIVVTVSGYNTAPFGAGAEQNYPTPRRT